MLQPLAQSEVARRFVFVVDLGLDVVHGYRWNSASGKLEPGNTLVLEAGTDPRHLTFSADGKWGLLQTEKTSMLMALAYDSDEGRFAQPTPARTTSTIPGDWNGISYGAEVCLFVHLGGQLSPRLTPTRTRTPTARVRGLGSSPPEREGRVRLKQRA